MIGCVIVGYHEAESGSADLSSEMAEHALNRSGSRLSEEGYTALKLACGAEQDSVSAVARRTVLEWTNSLAQRPRVDERLTEVREKLDTLLALLHSDQAVAAETS